MTAHALDSGASWHPALPRRALVISIALHAAALLLLPGIARQAGKLDLPPLIATLRPLPAAQPVPAALPAAAPEKERPAPKPLPQPQPAHSESRIAVAAPSPAPKETAPVAPPAAKPATDPAPRQEAVAAPAAPTPAATTPATPPPAPPEVDSLALDAYGRALSALLANQQQYPRLAAMRGWEGEVRLRLKVAHKGNLVSVQVVRSSGYEVLDQNAVQMIQGVTLPAPPDALGDRDIQIVIPVHYKLQKPT